MSNDIFSVVGVNIAEKATMIWNVADLLRGPFKPHEYGLVILPMTVVKRFHDCLLPTHQAVLDTYEKVKKLAVTDGFLRKAAGYQFYNTSKFTFDRLLADPENIESNFRDYLNGFSANVQDVLAKFDFDNIIKRMMESNTLYLVVKEFASQKGYLGPDKISAVDCGYIFEDLVRRFSESFGEEAGAHFTSRDIIYLMTDLLLSGADMSKQGNITVYDMTMGTSQMLSCMEERIHDINPDMEVTCFGQEFNPSTFAIAKADMMIRGGNPDNMRYGDTLSEDKFSDYTFRYIISNPPFGIDWKREKKEVEREAARGEEGRFAPGLPTVGDGQLLFMLNGIKKLRNDGTMAIIQNGSPLYYGEPESGTSEIRRYILENDLLSAIVRLPSDMFYNTALITYIWIITKDKPNKRLGKVQLIDASKCFVKRRRPIGKKKNDLDQDSAQLIVKAFEDFQTKVYEDGDKCVRSIVYDIEDFQFQKVAIFTPELDEKGNPITKRGIVQLNKNTKEEEKFDITVDVQAYIDEHPQLYAPGALIDKAKTKNGYEIPFTRIFFEFGVPSLSSQILSSIQDSPILDLELRAIDAELRKELAGAGEYKDSGVEWIGKIPVDWEVNPISYYFTERNERCNENDYQPLSVTKKGIVLQLETVAKSDAEGDSRKKVLAGDFVINSRSDRKQSCGVSRYDGSVSLINTVLKSKGNILPQYAHYILKNYAFAEEFFRWGHGIAMDLWTTNYIDMKKIMIPVPPIKIQEKISTLLEKLDALIEKREYELQQLKDYASVITYEAITLREGQ